MMRLDNSTWYEVEEYLRSSTGIIIPTGSTEQHGPIGLIGTDAICAECVAERAAQISGALVAPTIAFAPASFNLAFPGTISVEPSLFRQLAESTCRSLAGQGFTHFYFLNGHGANLEPLHDFAREFGLGRIKIESWWGYPEIREMRTQLYGDWEGMHATPSEIAVTQAVGRIVQNSLAAEPPRKLSAEYIAAASGDRHGPPAQHRAEFPDGRVGSHSALASAAAGHRLLKAAAEAAARDYVEFLNS